MSFVSRFVSFSKSFIATFLYCCLLACSQNSEFGTEETLPVKPQEELDFDFVAPRNPNLIKTTKGAAELDLETPLRCRVNWETQQLISAIPYNFSSFNLIKNGLNDMLPRFEVNGFSFKSLEAQKVLLKLDKEAGIHLIARDAPYARISGENLSGEFSDVVKMITDAAEIFYSYDAERKLMRLSRRANFTLYVPKSLPVMLGLLDVIRGAGITDIVSDWSDYSITFTADYETKEKIMDLVNYFKDNPVLVVYDVNVFRIYPNNKEKYIDWQAALDTFDFSTLNTSQAGIIGRVLTTTNALNLSTLRQFVGSQASVVPVAEGRFVVPNLWLSRFDVGKCSKGDVLEDDLSILAKASLEKNNWIFSDITLGVTNGEIAKFTVRSKLGENLMIIGLPNEIFKKDKPFSETVVFMVPKIIRATQTNQHIINQI